ncbi:hypothetical protein BC939DRAFT_58553 [Gamsiella multidivaricata]|uniref:uncharacterized protein n=1 Tax=Gamsiella multidivaricata TaxID=101098 RepID=UPI00221ED6B9|nr:uncharacterized protein BC939DRAFT_58553 [Gamsiella multidivaricata]KAI7816145.1 hypothetical protein BC939DRAFT_58553 [Gamsiella multidivaricata]
MNPTSPHYPQYPTSPAYDRASPTPSSPSSPAPSHDGSYKSGSKGKKPASAARLPESLLSSTIDFPKPKPRKKQPSEVGSPGPVSGADYHTAHLPTEEPANEENSEEDEASKQAKEDPLAAQVWRLYTKAKDSLPNGKRLENLTWRMMAMTLHKKNKEKEDKEREGSAMDLERPVPAGQPSYMDTVSSKPMPSMSISIPGPNQLHGVNSGLYDTTMQSDSDDGHDSQSNTSSTASSPREMRFSGIPTMTPIKSPAHSQNSSFKFGSGSSSVSPTSRQRKANSINNNSNNFGAGATGPYNSGGSSSSSRPTLSRSSTGGKSGHSSSSRNSTHRLSSYHGKSMSGSAAEKQAQSQAVKQTNLQSASTGTFRTPMSNPYLGSINIPHDASSGDSDIESSRPSSPTTIFPTQTSGKSKSKTKSKSRDEGVPVKQESPVQKKLLANPSGAAFGVKSENMSDYNTSESMLGANPLGAAGQNMFYPEYLLAAAAQQQQQQLLQQQLQLQQMQQGANDFGEVNYGDLISMMNFGNVDGVTGFMQDPEMMNAQFFGTTNDLGAGSPNGQSSAFINPAQLLPFTNQQIWTRMKPTSRCRRYRQSRSGLRALVTRTLDGTRTTTQRRTRRRHRRRLAHPSFLESDLGPMPVSLQRPKQKQQATRRWTILGMAALTR